MNNENIIIVSIGVLAVVLAITGLDNGDTIKLVITTYLGYVIGNRVEKAKSTDDTIKRRLNIK